MWLLVVSAQFTRFSHCSFLDLTLCSYVLCSTDLPQCTGESDLTDGQRIDLLCQSEFSGDEMPSLEWFQGGVAIKSKEESEIRTIGRRVIMDAVPDLDKVIFTCRMTFGDVEEECSIPMDIKCE